MKIHVDLFKQSGKWAYGDIVEISDSVYLWQDEFKQEIINNQNFVKDGTIQNGGYFIVTRDLDITEADPNYHRFNFHLFKEDAFKGFKKQI